MTFLVDTGSDRSLIHPGDARHLGVEYDRDFDSMDRVSSVGIGGHASELDEQCTVFLGHEDGEMDQIPVRIAIAIPTALNSTMPSLLGRDILRHYRLTFQESAGLVLLQRPEEL